MLGPYRYVIALASGHAGPFFATLKAAQAFTRRHPGSAIIKLP